MIKKLNEHFKKKKFIRITRRISKRKTKIERGYVVGLSNNFVILQETDDFRILGFIIIDIQEIESIRFNENDEYYDKIIEWEGLKESIKEVNEIELLNWESIFQSLLRINQNIVIECEKPKDDLFIIGEIIKVTDKSVSIRYFNAEGVWDKKPTKLKYKKVTRVMFQDRYIEIFSKYLKEKN